MEIVFKHELKATRVYKRAFELVTKLLGIDNEKTKIFVEVLSSREMDKGAGMQINTRPDDNGNYMLSINEEMFGFPLLIQMEAFAHELYHAFQMLREGLYGSTRGTSFYKGKKYQNSFINLAYSSGSVKEVCQLLPWEKDAYAAGPKLAKIVIERLQAEGLIKPKPMPYKYVRRDGAWDVHRKAA